MRPALARCSCSPQGNNYVFALLGAETQVVGLGGVDDAVAALLEKMKAEGKKPFFIPGGGSNAVGALGYAQAAVSIVEEVRKARTPYDAIVLCSGSGGTHAGMLAGLRAAGDDTPVYGISVRFDAPKQKSRIEAQYEACAALFGRDAPKDDVVIIDTMVGPGCALTPRHRTRAHARDRHPAPATPRLPPLPSPAPR